MHNISSRLQQAGVTSDTIFYSKVNDIDQMTAIRILSGTQSMLQEIKRIKEEDDLGAREESIEKEVYSLLIEIWTLLEDIRPKRLTAYGPLTERDKELLSHQIQGLLKMVNDMSSAIR